MISAATGAHRHLVQDLNRPATPHRALTTAATLGALGGLALFADLSLHAFGLLGRSYFILATGIAFCLLGGPIAYWLRGAITTGWRQALGIVATGIVVVGAAAWITAFTILFTHPEAAFTQRLTPAGPLLMALGMTLLGISTLTSRRLRGLRSIAPLAVGLYLPAQLIIQLTFFLNGNDGSPGPNGALLGTWGLLWAWAAWASATAKDRKRG